MEPNQVTPGGEQVPAPQAPEQAPLVPTPEKPAPEQQPTPAPAPAEQAQPAQPAVPQPVSSPSAPTAPASNQLAPPAGPAQAEDADLIEKEWVDKVDEIMEQTAGDPHAEEEAIEDLQIDYLKKRFGVDVKKSEEE